MQCAKLNVTKYHIDQSVEDAFEVGPVPTLEAVLAHRDHRIQFQQQLVSLYPNAVLIALKVNMPGPVKNNELIQTLLELGIEHLHAALNAAALETIYTKTVNAITGIEYFIVVNTSQIDLIKKLTIQLEDQNALGRLYDFDVYNSKGSLSREDLGYDGRRCLICNESSKACGRNRTHTVKALHKAMQNILIKEGSVTFNDETR